MATRHAAGVERGACEDVRGGEHAQRLRRGGDEPREPRAVGRPPEKPPARRPDGFREEATARVGPCLPRRMHEDVRLALLREEVPRGGRGDGRVVAADPAAREVRFPDRLDHDGRRLAEVGLVQPAWNLAVEDDVCGEPGEEDPGRWFWEWLENLGIDERCAGRGYSKDYLDQCIDDWLEGDITKNGKRSPFPVKRKGVDIRKKTLWMQCMAYVNEHI